ncbi:MAG: Rieske (2Fe-2S) protein [Acidobacteria bacterium]|nr:Rieske (2Fe-2S) protein [Acidobacteriota bacterium]MCB9396819.1 Rieske (2Fe-2S) protein [Acidobacteriota bacterium]
MNWTPVLDADQLRENTPKVIRHEGRAIVLFQRGSELFAYDQKCPHQGYPLSLGQVDGECRLTCFWHQWKFDLRTGRNIWSGDHLPIYPTRIEHGKVYLDFTPKDKTLLQKELLADLDEAMNDRDFERLARILVKWQEAKLDSREPLRWAIISRQDRFEYGMTHAYAAAEAWWSFSEEPDLAPADRITAQCEALDIIAFDTLRQPRFPFKSEPAPYDLDSLKLALANEHEANALGQIDAALQAGITVTELLAHLVEVALSHYASFGHALIYLLKIECLVSMLGPAVTRPLLANWVRHWVYATKEDRIPDFQSYGPLVAQLKQQGFGSNPEVPRPPQFPSIKATLAATVELAQNHTPKALWQSLLGQAAEQLLCFDARYILANANPVQDNVTWLDFTHALTFAEAVYHFGQKDPQIWSAGLLQLACFIGRNRPYLTSRAQPQAMTESQIRQKILDHGFEPPIFPAHYIKTFRAIRHLQTLAEPAQVVLDEALWCFLQASFPVKKGARAVLQAIQLLGKGEKQK